MPGRYSIAFAILPCADTSKAKEAPRLCHLAPWNGLTRPKVTGSIAPESDGNDVFVHISAVERSGLTGLADDQKVSYELTDGREGRQMATELALL